jgi:sigma-B regulation protein RsbU (phosphoserine phosphatase)
MNGNRLTQISFSSHVSPFLDPAPALQETTHIPGLDYYARRRACENGADFFELIPRSGAGLALCMGSVPAHGTDSALMISCLETILRSLGADAAARPASIVHSLNQFVHDSAGENSYAALFYASIDPLRRELRYVNAGHEPALLLRKRQDRAIRLESTGAVLGLTHRSSYGQRCIPLEPGDLLAVFSEGVADTFNIHGQPFGSAGVLNVLRRSGRRQSPDLVEEILSAAERHAGWSAHFRDQTVAVARFTGSREQAVPAEEEAELSFAAA